MVPHFEMCKLLATQSRMVLEMGLLLGACILLWLIMSCLWMPQTALGITVSDSVDMSIHGNNLRGFETGIRVTDKDRIRISSNTIDLSHSSTAHGVVVDAKVTRLVLSDNDVSGSSSSIACVDIGQGASGTRVQRDNQCW